jgi:hypothetical protein
MIFLPSVLIVICVASSSRAAALPTQAQWAKFNRTINGRLFHGIPLAEPCYANYNGTTTTPNSAACSAVQAGYTNTTYLAGQYSGFANVRLLVSLIYAYSQLADKLGFVPESSSGVSFELQYANTAYSDWPRVLPGSCITVLCQGTRGCRYSSRFCIC